MSLCLCVCPSAMTLKWLNIVNSPNIAIQLHMSKYPPRYVAIDIWHSPNTSTTTFMTTLSVSPKSFKCNISVTNYPIPLNYNTGVKHPKVHTQKLSMTRSTFKLHSWQHFMYPPILLNTIFPMNNCSIVQKLCTKVQYQ